LGLPATMSFLVRTRVGKFNLVDSWTLEEIEAVADKREACFSADGFLDMETIKLDAEKLYFFKTGRSIFIDYPTDFSGIFTDAADKPLTVKVSDQHDKFVGIGRFSLTAENSGCIKPVKVLATDVELVP